jgi:hypothetical protein
MIRKTHAEMHACATLSLSNSGLNLRIFLSRKHYKIQLAYNAGMIIENLTGGSVANIDMVLLFVVLL